jgi:hypothetical protein
MVVVDLTLAIICFMNQCHPVLVGPHTPQGTFLLDHQATPEAGYGGDLLVFQEGSSQLWAIHRVTTGVASERRVERLQSPHARMRRGVTHGCVNVMPQVFDSLVRCCAHDVLMIHS